MTCNDLEEKANELYDYISAKVMRELKEGNVYSSINKTCA